MARFKFKELFWISPDEDEPEAPPGDGAASGAAAVAPPVSSPPSSLAGPGIERILSALQDVEGVVGGIVTTDEGTLSGNSLPPVFDQETLKRVGARIAQVRTALATDAEPHLLPKGGALRFRDYQLYLNPLSSGMIGVLAEERVNVPALTMALRVVAKQLEARLGEPPLSQQGG